MGDVMARAFFDELEKIKEASGGKNIAALLARRMGQSSTTGAPAQVQHLLQSGNVEAGRRVLNNVKAQFPKRH